MLTSNTLEFNFLIFKPAEQRKQSRQVAGLLLAAVLALHIGLAWYLLSASKTEPTKQPVVMEVSLLSKSAPAAQPAATELPPVKKEPEKPKPLASKAPTPVKKTVTVKKTELKPQPPTIADVKPAIVEPAPPAATPTPAAVAPSNAPAAAKPASKPDADNKTVVSGVVPLVIVKPIYPSRAASRGTEGWVKVEFTIQTDGSVDDAVVLQSEPEGIFDDAALAAINKWKFKEKMINGVAVPHRAVQLLQFKLDR